MLMPEAGVAKGTHQDWNGNPWPPLVPGMEERQTDPQGAGRKKREEGNENLCADKQTVFSDDAHVQIFPGIP